MASAFKAAKAALVADLATVYVAPVQVCYGHPGTYMADDIVSVGAGTADREIGPLSTQRKLTETLNMTVTLSSWRGGVAAQQTATEAAFDLLATLETYLTDVGTPDSAHLTLGHTVWRAWIDRYELVETDVSMTDSAGTPLLNQGRLAEITATITATARI